jgi:hypothetical protein
VSRGVAASNFTNDLRLAFRTGIIPPVGNFLCCTFD